MFKVTCNSNTLLFVHLKENRFRIKRYQEKRFDKEERPSIIQKHFELLIILKKEKGDK